MNTPTRKLTRRTVLQGSTSVFGLGLFACSSIPKPRIRRPDEEIRIAVVGVRSRGDQLVRSFRNVPNVKLVAICDVDQEFLDQRAAQYDEAGHPVETYVDLRRVLDRKDIDAVVIATPNHLHAMQAIWACQAGKDVYLEKPVSHNIWEGRQIVDAAAKYQRIVMTGTQSRSSHGIGEGIEWVRAGNLGAIQLARGLCYKPRPSIGKVSGPQVVPSSIDYDLWCGPAEMRPLMRKSLHYDWHWDHLTGNGDVGNQGIHQMDIARWAIGEAGLPPRVLSVGGRFGYDDDGNTPNTQVVLLDYDRVPILFEVRGLPRNSANQQSGWNGAGMDQFRGARVGVVLHCEGGHVLIPNYSEAIVYDADGQETRRFQGASSHSAHFIDVVRSRRVEDMRAPIRQGHVSSALCHMGNASHLLGAASDPDQIRETLHANSSAIESWERMQAHLEANAVDLTDTPATLGPWLKLDAATERFEDERANRVMSRDYRAPFRVPERV